MIIRNRESKKVTEINDAENDVRNINIFHHDIESSSSSAFHHTAKIADNSVSSISSKKRVAKADP